MGNSVPKWTTLCAGTITSLLALSGCSGGEEQATPTVTVTVTPSATAAPTMPGTQTATTAPTATPEPVAAQGFPEGTRYWTFQDGAGSPVRFAAYSKRSGDSMCLIKMYPEYVVETGTVADTAAGQEFAVNERAETMLNPYVPPYLALVTGDPDEAIAMTWSQGMLVFDPTDVAGAAAAVAASNPGTDGMEALARITPACG